MKNKFEKFNQYALECLYNYIRINRINEKHFETTKSRTMFNTGDKYTDNVYLYHSINTRREGFKFLLEDYFLQENSLTFENHNLVANSNWNMYDYLFLIYSHRILGSGTSNEFNHGYNNSELIHFKNYNNYTEFLDYLNNSTNKFCSCCVNQPPRYNLKWLITEHFKPFADHILANIKPKMTITEIVKIMNDYNQTNNLHRFNFHYLLMAGDLRDYCNLDTKINGLFDIDMHVECPLGPTSHASMKILRPGYKYTDFMNLCERYDMTPIDLEDLLCVWLKYIHNPIWEYYIKPEHTMADFENGWDVVETKHRSYYKFKEILEKR